jgi:hypothetical protein
MEHDVVDPGLSRTGDRGVEELDGHVVVLNTNEKVRRIVDEIALGWNGGTPDIVLMIQDRQMWQAHPAWHPLTDAAVRLHVVDGCPTEPADLEAVHIDRARAAVILADPRQGRLADAHSTLVAVAIERRCPQVHTVMELIDSVNRVHLRSTEVNEVVCMGELAERLIAQSCITPGIADVFAHLLHAHPGTTQTFVVNLPEGLTGTSYRQLVRRAIEARAPFVVCGFAVQLPDGPSSTSTTSHRTFVLNPRTHTDPGKDTALASGDQLVVIAYDLPDLSVLVG